MDVKSLRRQINDMHMRMLELLEEYERLTQPPSVAPSYDLRDLLTDEEMIMEFQSEEVLKEIDQRLIDEFDLNVDQLNKDALAIVMMDNSGSMGFYEKYLANCLWTRLERLLKLRYKNVKIKLIQHHTHATEVTKDKFFVKGESGGTICSSAYKLANQMIEEFNYVDNDVFVLHMSDGDNLTSDMDRVVDLVKKLSHKSKFVGYFEINKFNRHSIMMAALKKLNNDKFNYFVASQRDDIYDALGEFCGVIF